MGNISGMTLGAMVGLLLTVSAGFSKTVGKPKWTVEGLYVEACQCSIPCPCNFGQKPTHGSCDNTSVYQIEKGNYEGLRRCAAWRPVCGRGRVEPRRGTLCGRCRQFDFCA